MVCSENQGFVSTHQCLKFFSLTFFLIRWLTLHSWYMPFSEELWCTIHAWMHHDKSAGL